jgi:hypothetical protein
MAAESLRSLSLPQAVQRFEAMQLPLRPATLHPRYVAADASRNAILEPVYLAFERQGHCWTHNLHLTAIAGTDLKDASSPYGYGGPLSSSDDPEFLGAAWQAYTEWMTQQRVVVEYVRFHPAVANERFHGGQAADNRVVVWMDLSPPDLVAAYAPRLRHTLKKAGRAALVYRETPLASYVHEFGVFYRQAMGEIAADPFFLFDDAYFGLLAASGFARLGVCRRDDSADGPWLAACIFLDGGRLREYHLAATSAEGRAVGASAFTLHHGALSARSQGLRRLYLGGGSDARPANPLLFFKSAFSTERLTYRTGASVFRSADYDRLKQLFPAAWSAHPERPIFYRKV